MRTTADPGPARRCAVLGAPISHSLSPVIHRAAYRHLGLDWTYTAHEVGEDELPGFLSGLDHRWRGLSLTMPLKKVALEVATEISPQAQQLEVANTLVRLPDDGWRASNTDLPGFLDALAERQLSDQAPDVVCIWGAGATATTALAASVELGAGRIHLHARSPERAQRVAAVTRQWPGAPAVDIRPWQIGDECLTARLTVNTAPAGALDGLAAQLSARGGPERVLFEVLYDPWPTPIAHHWDASGGVVLGGLDLLVHQAAGQVVAMTGRPAPIDVLRAAAEQGLAARAMP
nr:shikimate dehydrogenase [Phytoactinopolyspora limicola]